MPKLLSMINDHLQNRQLQVQQASTSIVDATMISTAGSKQPKNRIVTKDHEVIEPSPSKDPNTKWTKKGVRFYLGDKLYAVTDGEDYCIGGHVTPANAHETKHLNTFIRELARNTQVQADKGYASKANRVLPKITCSKMGLCKKQDAINLCEIV